MLGGSSSISLSQIVDYYILHPTPETRPTFRTLQVGVEGLDRGFLFGSCSVIRRSPLVRGSEWDTFNGVTLLDLGLVDGTSGDRFHH